MFEGNLKSPLFDAKNPVASGQLTRVKIQDRRFKKINCRSSPNNPRFVSLEYDDGSQTIYDQNNSRGKMETREIPENHVIVGIYGVLDISLYQLGFIVAEL